MSTSTDSPYSPPIRAPQYTLANRPDVARSVSLSGSTSGSASPLTQYGSFPPRGGNLKGLESRLRDSLRKEKTRKITKKIWERKSSQRILYPSRRSGDGRDSQTLMGEDVYDSDADMSDDQLVGTSERQWEGDEEDGIWTAGDSISRPVSSKGKKLEAGRLRRERSGGYVETEEEEKQWGVVKMELMARTWGRSGLLAVFTGVYLISALTSLEANTTPTIEPYFLSLLSSHSLLGTVFIVTNIAFAVGKPVTSKILDVWGRAEGVAFSVVLYSVGYLLTASSTNVRMYIFARALAALGGQGLQLAQQVIIADTTTLTNRALITSTISLPWLVTTWLGPPLGAFFQSRGERGYRIGYALFGILLPLAAGMLIFTLMMEWRKAKSSAVSRSPSASVEGWIDKSGDKPVEASQGNLSSKLGKLWRELDVVGLIALTLACGFILLPLSLAAGRPARWADPAIWTLILAGLVSFTFFVYYECHFSTIPLLPPRLLRNRTILCGSILGFFHFCSQFCYESFFTSFLQVARNHSPKDASYISQSYIFSASIAAIAAGFASKYTQRYRWIGILGVIIHIIGTWMMSRARRLDSSTFELVMSQIIGGVGGGATTIAAQAGVQSVVGHQHVAIATACFLTITQVGGAFGASIAGAVWSTFLPVQLRHHLDPESHHYIEEIMSSLPYAMSFPTGSPIRIAINESYVDVQSRLNILAIILLLPALVAVCLMKNVHLEKDDQGQGEGVVVLGRASFLVTEEDAVCSETSSLLGSS